MGIFSVFLPINLLNWHFFKSWHDRCIIDNHNAGKEPGTDLVFTKDGDPVKTMALQPKHTSKGAH